MKGVYWRPNDVSRRVLLLICVASLGGLFVVERFKSSVQQPHYAEKLTAATLAQDAMIALKAESWRRGLRIDLDADPARSGLIGAAVTSVTSLPGNLLAKQTTINPNFAAVVVQLLKELRVSKGDTIAVGFSGSFPALNVCVLAAAQTLELKPIVISGVSASQWGANEPEFLWLDMEKVLFDRGLIRFRSAAASIGGVEDRGRGMAKAGRDLIGATIERHGLTFLKPQSYEDSIEQRMAIYRQLAGEKPIVAYINVGGVTSSIGKAAGRKAFKAGINRLIPPGVAATDSIMGRFLSDHATPTVNLRRVKELADRYGLPIAPAPMPTLGDGSVFTRIQYNTWLAAAVLAAVLAVIWVFMRTGAGERLLTTTSRASVHDRSEPMV